MGSVEWRCDSGKRTGFKIAFQLCQSLRNSSTPEPPKSRGRFAETRIQQEMRPRACRFESKVALSRVTNFRCRDARKAGVKHRCDQTSKRRMQRQQYLVDLGKIMAIPQRLEILADYRLHHCPHARDTPEFESAAGHAGRWCSTLTAAIASTERVRIGKPTRRKESSAPRSCARQSQPSPANDRAQSPRIRLPSTLQYSCQCRRQLPGRIERPTTADPRSARPQPPARRTANCHMRRHLAVVDRSGNWHGKSRPCLCQNDAPGAALRQPANAVHVQDQPTKKRQMRLNQSFLGSACFANSANPVVEHARWRATLAQLVEQLIRNQQVVGSNPTGGSRKSNRINYFPTILALP